MLLYLDGVHAGTITSSYIDDIEDGPAIDKNGSYSRMLKEHVPVVLGVQKLKARMNGRKNNTYTEIVSTYIEAATILFIKNSLAEVCAMVPVEQANPTINWNKNRIDICCSRPTRHEHAPKH